MGVNSISAEVIERAKRGDHQAFAELVEWYHARALRFARLMLDDTQDAEDAVQEAFVRVWDALPRFREGAPFEPWFFRVLANRCRTAIGRRARHQTDELPINLADERQESDGVEFGDEVRRVLETLPAEQREAFLLHHVEGFDYDEIAAVTGARSGALRMRVKRAIDTLRTKLGGVVNA